MQITLPWRIRAGCSLALVVVLSALGSIILSHVSLLRPYLYVAVLCIAIVGLIFLVQGRLKATPADEQSPEKGEAAESYLSEHPLIFFRKPDYWGWVFLASALPIFFITKVLYGSEVPVQPPKPAQQVVRVEEPEVQAMAPIEFPSLKLSGFVCNGAKSTAVIDGATVRLGGFIKGVKVVAVRPDGVIVELGGNQKRLVHEEAATSNPVSRRKNL